MYRFRGKSRDTFGTVATRCQRAERRTDMVVFPVRFFAKPYLVRGGGFSRTLDGEEEYTASIRFLPAFSSRREGLHADKTTLPSSQIDAHRTRRNRRWRRHPLRCGPTTQCALSPMRLSFATGSLALSTHPDGSAGQWSPRHHSCAGASLPLPNPSVPATDLRRTVARPRRTVRPLQPALAACTRADWLCPRR